MATPPRRVYPKKDTLPGHIAGPGSTIPSNPGMPWASRLEVAEFIEAARRKRIELGMANPRQAPLGRRHRQLEKDRCGFLQRSDLHYVDLRATFERRRRHGSCDGRPRPP